MSPDTDRDTSPVGPLLALCGIAAIVWLALNDRLGWYIHPRYIWFTLIMCVGAALVLIAAAPYFRWGRCRTVESTSESTSDPVHRSGRLRRVVGVTGVGLLVTATVIGLLIVPPTTLSTDLAQQRSVVGAGGQATIGSLDEAPAAASADDPETLQFWAAQLRSQGGAGLEGTQASVTGFVLAQDDQETFLTTRLAISCCIVDAQPIGVPVLLPAWEEEYQAGDWVRVSGVFVAHPDPSSRFQVVLRPTDITVVPEPSDPYVY